MSEAITKAEQRILGFLVGAGGDRLQGSTIRDIQEGSGLSHNTVYLAMRKGIPGVIRCMSHTNTGAAMYYCTADSIRDTVQPIMTKEIRKTIFDSTEWASAPEVAFGALTKGYDSVTASRERILEVNKVLQSNLDIDEPNNMTYWAMAATAQLIAKLAIDMARQLAVEGTNG